MPITIITRLFSLLFLLTLIFGCSQHRPTTKLLSKITPQYEVYAPDSTSLEGAVIDVDSAYHRISRILGEHPPQIAFLLFANNKELLNYDYSVFLKRRIHYLPWLSEAGIEQLSFSDSGDGVSKSLYFKRTVELISQFYDSLGIILAKDETYQSERIYVQKVAKNIRNVQFKKDDIILELNGQPCKNLSQFDSIYTSLESGSDMRFLILRKQEQIVLNRPKPTDNSGQESASKNLVTEYSKEDSASLFKKLNWNVVAHEAGHIFFIAFIDSKIDKYIFLNETTTKAYGHPLAPDWLDEAMAIFCESDDEQNFRIRQLKFNNCKAVVNLAEFLRLNHPNVSHESDAPKSKIISKPTYYNQSIAFARYLFENEGAAFMAAMAIGLAKGKEFEKILLGAKQIPQDLSQLNSDFVEWLRYFNQ